MEHPGILGAMLLSAESLTRIRRGEQVLDDVHLRIRRGEVVGVLGRNGAGKTTLLHLLAGLDRANRGSIHFDDRDVTEWTVDERARAGLVLVLHQDSVFHDLTVEENLRAVAPTCPAADLLGQYGLTKVATRKAATLSGGERRRLTIARAMAASPSLLILDEPFSGVDPVVVGELQGFIRSLPLRGTSVLFSDHNVRESLSICDRAYILHEGRMLKDGTPSDIVA